jgi:adenylosuccinate lyase
MRHIWSEIYRRRLWRRVWVALATAQSEVGLVTADQIADLKARQDDIDLERALFHEAQLHHDVMAEIRTYAEQCPIGGGIIHLGATSMDILDNADALRLREAMVLIKSRLRALLETLAAQIETWAISASWFHGISRRTHDDRPAGAIRARLLMDWDA